MHSENELSFLFIKFVIEVQRANLIKIKDISIYTLKTKTINCFYLILIVLTDRKFEKEILIICKS